jgi:hypothetical protein
MSRPDMYALLRSYAERIKSPYINIGEFVNFSDKNPDWAEGANEVRDRFVDEIPILTENGQCALVKDGKESGVFITAYFRERILAAYTDIEKTPESPFPGTVTLKIKVPENCVHSISLTTDLGVFFGVKENEDEIGLSIGRLNHLPDPQDIIRIHFPDKCGSALVPVFMIPRRLMEMSLSKIGHYLSVSNNKEYLLNKMNSLIPDAGQGIREFFDKIMMSPADCISEMERVIDFPYLFWTHFCPQIKNDMGRKKELYPEDIAVLQAVRIVEVCSGFYRSIAARKRDIEAAFKIVETYMENPPYRYTMEDISAFTNDQGVFLLKIYSREELQAYVKRATTESKNGLLPEWITMKAGDGRRCFVKKPYYFSICIEMISEVRSQIKGIIFDRWTKIIKDFSKEASMESEVEFNKLLEKHTRIINPALWELLGDPKLLLVYDELERNGDVPKHARIVKNNTLIPYSGLYSLKRRELVSDVRLAIPFWYSIPIIVSIIAFFKKPKKKKGAAAKDTDNTDALLAVSEKENSELQSYISSMEAEIVPRGKTPEEYLSELEKRWSGLFDKKDRHDRISGVKALVRDHLREMKARKENRNFTRERLREISAVIVTGNPALKTFKDRESLRLYIELYMLKLMGNR